MADDNAPEPDQQSRVIPGLRGNSNVYIDHRGFSYYQHSVHRGIRYLRCARRRYGCAATGQMRLEDGSPISLNLNHSHTHEPQPRHDIEVRAFFNRIRERGALENVQPQAIFAQDAQMFPEAALEVGRPAAIRAISRARRRTNPPVPMTLIQWPIILESLEWGPRLLNCNGTEDRFFQGPLEILNDDGSVQFVGVAFANYQFLQQMNVHLMSVHTLCIDGTYQVRPSTPNDISQLLTIQIVINNVAIPIIHTLLVSHTTETYCRVLQFMRHDLGLNLPFENLQIITDFEQGLRNATRRVFPEAINTGCWFHFIRCLTRYVRTNALNNLFNTSNNARIILRMLMALPHLPAEEVIHHGNRFSMLLGFRQIQDFVREYRLEDDLFNLMRYFERFWMDTIRPENFCVHQLRHRTNNFIESYHSTLLRIMGQHPPLYRFYEHLRSIEQRSRDDLTRAVNGQPVRRVEYRGFHRPRNNIIINNAWERCLNGTYNLVDFIRNVSYTPEQILREEIGEPNFVQPFVLPAAPLPLRPLPPPALLPIRPRLAPPAQLQIRPHLAPPAQLPIRPPPRVIQSPPLAADNLPQTPRPAARLLSMSPEGYAQDQNQALDDFEHQGRRHRNIGVIWDDFFREIDEEDDQGQVVPEPQEELEVQEVCAVCLDNLNNVTLLPCNHNFCHTCVLRLVQERHTHSPLCRTQILGYQEL